jgi:hypothetical protein
MSKFILLLAFLLVSSTNMQAEIQLITVTWKPSTCPLNCAQSLEGQFKQIPGVAGVTVYPLVGKAELRWKPTSPFSFSPINTAVRMVGPSIYQLFAKVRGSVRRNSDGTFQIFSIGDNTGFYLIGPINAQPNQYTTTGNVATHPLTAENVAVLTQAVQNNYLVIINGPIFQFWRSPPLILQIAQIQLVIPEEQTKATNAGITSGVVAPTPTR